MRQVNDGYQNIIIITPHPKTLKRAFFSALLVHFVLFIIITVSFVSSTHVHSDIRLSFQQSDKIIQATAVDQKAVDAAMQQLTARKAAKEKAAAAQIKALQTAAKSAEAAKKAQEKALLALKKQQQADIQKAKATLADLKAQQQKLVVENAAKAKAAQLAAAETEHKTAALKDLQQALQTEQTQLAKQEDTRVNNEIQKYTVLMLQAMQANWHYPTGIDPNLYCVLHIALSPVGEVQSVQLAKSSGNAMLDQSAIAAVYRSSPLPMPTDPILYQKMQSINLKVQPELAG